MPRRGRGGEIRLGPGRILLVAGGGAVEVPAGVGDGGWQGVARPDLTSCGAGRGRRGSRRAVVVRARGRGWRQVARPDLTSRRRGPRSARAAGGCLDRGHLGWSGWSRSAGGCGSARGSGRLLRRQLVCGRTVSTFAPSPRHLGATPIKGLVLSQLRSTTRLALVAAGQSSSRPRCSRTELISRLR